MGVSNIWISPTNRQKLEAQKTCDIIIPVSLVSSADNCYIFQPFKYLNCLKYTKHIATLAEFVLLASWHNLIQLIFNAPFSILY
jgi:hypothetical protein